MPQISRVFIVAIAFLLGSASLAGAQVRPVVQSTADHDQMVYNAEMMEDYQGLVRSWSRAMANGDVRAASRLYTDNAVMIPEPGEMVNGRAEIEAALGALAERWRNIRIGLLDFEASGSLLYGLGTYAYDQGVGEQTSTVSGTYVLVLHRGGRNVRIRSQTFHPPAE